MIKSNPCQSTGANNPQVSENIRKDKKECRGCGQMLDRKGHHLQCCNAQHRGTWQDVHEELNDTWIGLAKAAGLKNTKKRANYLPRPDDDKSDMHADVYFDFHNANVIAIICYCTIGHPFMGAGRDEAQWGKKVPKKLETMSSAKDKMYFEFHRDQGSLFLPLAVMTFGEMELHLMHLL